MSHKLQQVVHKSKDNIPTKVAKTSQHCEKIVKGRRLTDVTLYRQNIPVIDKHHYEMYNLWRSSKAVLYAYNPGLHCATVIKKQVAG